MDEELSTDAIGIPPRSDQRDDSGVDQTSNTPDPSASQNTLYTHEETNTQSKSNKLEKPLQSENTNTIKNKHKIDPSTDLPVYDRNQTISSASDSRDDHPTMSNEYINAETNAPKTKSLLPDKVMVTHDKDKLHIASSIPTLPREPPLEWRLNDFLHDIAQEIVDSDLEKIKLLFTGPDSLGEDLLNECGTFFKLFTVLKEKRYISKDNILYLNKILYNLGRRDLIERCVRYCYEEGDVIHYYSFEGPRESGTRYVKIHVVADLQKYDKESLERLRYRVASIVCAPIEVVRVYAVEPGSSLLITFVMPDIYVDVLKGLLQGKVNLWRLCSLQVDIVIVDDIRYDVSGLSSDKMVSEQYKEIRNVYEQLEEKRKELEQLEITHLKRLEELKDLKLQFERKEKVNHVLTATCSMLQNMHLTSYVNDAVLDGFQSLIQEASDKKQDMRLIQKIIKSNTEITAAYHRSVNEMKQEGQILKLKERKMSNDMLLRELSLNLKSAEEILHTKYSQHTLDVVIPLNLLVTKSLVDLSKTLKTEERDILMRKISWSEDDVVKACIEADTSLLLLGLACKQTEQTQKKIDAVQFLTAYGKEIGKDLLKMFDQIFEDQKKKVEDEQRNEFNLNLIKQLASKQKSPEEILLFNAEHFNFTIVISLDKQLVRVSASFLVNRMAQKSKGLILFLNEEECTQLMSSFTWLEQDVIKECIKADIKLLFPGLLCKQMERIGDCVLPEEVIKHLQRKIERKDLLGLYDQVKTTEKELQVQIERWHQRKKKESQLLKELSLGKTTAEEVLLWKLKNNTLKLAEEIETMPNFGKVTQVLRDLSRKVSNEDQAKLIELYKWEENDIIKECIAVDQTLLLEGLWSKDMDMKQSRQTIESFLSCNCAKINRADLVNQFRDDIKTSAIDDKVIHHVIDKTAEYFINAPNVHNILNNTQSMQDDSGATPIPRDGSSPPLHSSVKKFEASANVKTL